MKTDKCKYGCKCLTVSRMREGIDLHVSSPPSEAQQLLVLAGDEVDSGVLQQGREHKQQTYGHPDIDGFYIGHL